MKLLHTVWTLTKLISIVVIKYLSGKNNYNGLNLYLSSYFFLEFSMKHFL